MVNKVKDAIAVLKEAMIKDPAYAYGWHANIAMSFYDAIPENPSVWKIYHSEIHRVCNEGATCFMKRLFDIETSQVMLSDPMAIEGSMLKGTIEKEVEKETDEDTMDSTHYFNQESL